MRIAILQLNATIGDVESNYKKIIKCVEGIKDKVDLFVCPELSLTGYPPKDLLTLPFVLAEEKTHLLKLADFFKSSEFGIIIGHTTTVSDNPQKLMNSASLIFDGQIKKTIHKKRLPSYDIFDEKRYFSPGDKDQDNVLKFKDKSFHLSICEDLWDQSNAFGVNDLIEYASSRLEQQKFDFFVNIAASPFCISKQARRLDNLKAFAITNNCGGVYVNTVGTNDDLIFDGASFCLSKKSILTAQLSSFKEEVLITDLNASETKPSPSCEWQNCFDALVLGIKDYFKKQNFQKAIVGVSGGLDSALVATLAVEALGPENIIGVGLKTKHTSELSLKLSRQLCSNLKISLQEHSIQDAFELFSKKLKIPEGGLSNENIQSRLRGLTLMSLSNMNNALVLSTGNKSEYAMGYATTYGDIIGALAPIGDLYKTEAYGLCHFINLKKGNLIPEAIMQRAPSAELKNDQKDTDSLPEYSVLDTLIFDLIENQGKNLLSDKWSHFVPKKFTANEIAKKVFSQEFKRYQAPPILKVQQRSFGSGWRMPLAKKIL